MLLIVNFFNVYKINIILPPKYFFFFFEKPDPKCGLVFIEKKKTSRGITQNQRGNIMSLGQSTNQTSKSGATLARLANALATALHERGTKQNSEKFK